MLNTKELDVANIDDVINAVVVDGHPIGRTYMRDLAQGKDQLLLR